MSKLFHIISLEWIKNLRIAYDKKRKKKRVAYYEKLWDMKLKGLR